MALLADGWRLRNRVVWAKSNPMPSSVRDRLSCTHELLFFFVRSRHYYFDLDAIRIPHASGRRPPADAAPRYPPVAAVPLPRKGWPVNPNTGLSTLKQAGAPGHPLGKNPGDVWPLPTASFRGEHFATFPARLVERPLLATCPERVCGRCGAPWRRMRRRDTHRAEPSPSCSCNANTVNGLVLDPFMGTGTVAAVAARVGRDWIGVELNPAYVRLAERRLQDERKRAA